MNTSITTVQLDSIHLRQDLWPRFEIDYERARLFAELYREQGPDALPPPEVVNNGQGGFYAGDGVHRICVMKALDFKQATVILLGIPSGQTPEQVAYQRALETSSHAAKPLSRAERNAAVRKLIEQRPDLSDREVGRLAGVSHQTVARRRSEPEPHSPDLPASSPSTTQAQSPEERLSRLIKRLIEQTETSVGVGDQIDIHRAGSAQRFTSALRIAYGDAALDHAGTLQRWVAHALAALGDEGR